MSNLKPINLDHFFDNKNVEFVHLSEIVTFQRGKRIKKSELTDDGEYPAINGGKAIMGYTNKFNKPKNSVIIVREGSCGFSYFVEQDFWLGDCCYDVNPKAGLITKYGYDETMFKKFIYYIFQINQSRLQSKVHGTVFAKLTETTIGKLVVPLLKKNDLEKLVIFLDKFSNLNIDLQDKIDEKLNSRRKQFNYYFNHLLSDEYLKRFTDNNVEWVNLSEVAKVVKGKHKFTKATMIEDGLYPVMNGGKKPSGYANEFNREKDTIIISQSGASAGSVNYMTTKFWLNGDAFSIEPKDEFINKNNFNKLLFNKVLFYLIKNLEPKLQGSKNGGIFQRIYPPLIESIQVPVLNPNHLEKLENLLSELDEKYNKLFNELEEKAELRNKQYLYYREALFNYFKPAE